MIARQRVAIGVLCVAAAIGVAEPVAAQSQPGGSSQTGSLITRSPASVHGTTKTHARQTTRQFATCVLLRSPGQVSKMLAMAVDSPDFEKQLDRVAVDECLGAGELKLATPLMRTALIEASYVKAFGRTGPTDFARTAPVDYRAGYSVPLSQQASHVIALARIGDCVTRANGGAAKGLVLSIPGTSLEDKALSALMPKLAPCVPQGLKVTFSRSVLRGAVAEGLYRLSMASVSKLQSANR